jgi:hypothetical protein
VGGADRFAFVLSPTNGELSVTRLVRAAGVPELLRELGVRSGGDQPVADPTGELDRVFPRRCDGDRRRLVGNAVNALTIVQFLG